MIRLFLQADYFLINTYFEDGRLCWQCNNLDTLVSYAYPRDASCDLWTEMICRVCACMLYNYIMKTKEFALNLQLKTNWNAQRTLRLL